MKNVTFWKRRYGRAGFTLVEILGVVALLGVLAALTYTVFSRGTRTSQRMKCDVNLKSLAFALDAYRQEHDFFPTSLDELRTGGYVQDKAIMRCPADPNPKGSYNDYYVLRIASDSTELPILVCPFHEDRNQGGQAYIGRYTTQFMTRPAILKSANATTIQRPNQSPVAAPAGLVLHGADRLVTAKNGKATIEFADGSMAELKKNSEIMILQSFLEGKTRPTLYTLLKQTAGDIVYTVHVGSKFDVTTPTGTAGALGTKFEITIDPDDMTLLVTQGKVRFNNKKRKVIVNNGVPAKAKNKNK